MQVFKLVRHGQPDSIIGFDSLPNDMLRGITRGPIAGWQRNWFDFLEVDYKDKEAKPFYTLDYITRNNDKQKWQEITSYVKRNVSPTVRLLDKVEAMAIPVAQDAYSDVLIQPEDMPLIVLEKKEPKEIEPLRKRGRKPKEEEAIAA